MSALRTKEGNRKYAESKKNGQNQLSTTDDGRIIYDVDKFSCYIKEYQYWHMVSNEFPYDRVAEDHDLLIPKRVFATSQEMNDQERDELEQIKHELQSQYHCVVENLSAKSILDHHHIHFIKWKGEDVQPGGHAN